MSNATFIKPIPLSELKGLIDLIDYEAQSVLKKTLVNNDALSIAILSLQDSVFSNQNNSGKSMIQVLEGDVIVTTNPKKQKLIQGETCIIPATIYHAFRASSQAKLLYTMVLDPDIIQIDPDDLA